MSHGRVCFVHSPKVYYEQNYGARFTPVWAYTLAAYAPPNWDLCVYDLTIVDKSEIPEATIFVFSGINQDFPSIKSVHDYLRAQYPTARFVLGGPMCWSFEKDGKLSDLDFFDHIFIMDGEETFPDFLRKIEQGHLDKIQKVIRGPRFSVSNAKKLRFDLLKASASKYYGGVIEVSRGCPFLCEFCDIRVLPNNNEAHTKNIELVVQELDAYWRLGVRQIQLACDNFIGNLVWAHQCVDAILEWEERTGAQMALYTWLTVNISRLPDLMKKMRRAGFTTFFIGVESFNKNSILETAKVQNKNEKSQLIESLKHIQSYGFIVAPGLIFGFDNDPPSLFMDMLQGVVQSGLISGDPTFLIALPGTPLYDRMKRTDRLIMGNNSHEAMPLHKERISKIESNIRYLQPKDFLTKGFIHFIRYFVSPEIMYERFRRHVTNMMASENFVASHPIGYGSLPEYLKFQFSSWLNLKMLLKRISTVLRPRIFWAIIKAYALVLRHRGRYKGLKNHFTFWLFMWSNLLVKYGNLKEEDFKLHSVAKDYNLGKLWEELEFNEPNLLPNGRNEDNVKVGDQLRSTNSALSRLKQTLESTYDLSSFKL